MIIAQVILYAPFNVIGPADKIQIVAVAYIIIKTDEFINE